MAANRAIDIAREGGSTQTLQLELVKSACLYECEKFDQSIGILKDLKKLDNLKGEEYTHVNAALKSVITDKALKKENKEYNAGKLNMIRPPAEHRDLVISEHREVENKLIDQLMNVEQRRLVDTQDTRYGNGTCSDFNLFTNEASEIHTLYQDLHKIIKDKLSKTACNFKSDSFLNVFNKGAGQPAHSHIKPQDYNFNLSNHKYSLIYYLDVGDQNCENPGILEFHHPYGRVKPTKGMILIFPATRLHSVKYEGSQTRLMVGINFYAFNESLVT